ncbi:MAG: hypothetical protein ACLP0J_24470 [Solirubrobacteraceae bacterium]|jgi:hypothetical protein
MSSGNPLGPLAHGAQTVEQALARAIATADQEWKDSARRSFDVQHLERIRVDARQMTDELVDMAGRLRAAAALLAADG